MESSELDRCVKHNLIKKSLENDRLYYVEGGKLNNHLGFINEEKFKKEFMKQQLEERALSSGDY